MENRCKRCNRVLSDPDAVYGWKCAEILGVANQLSRMDPDIFRKFAYGVLKAREFFGNSNIEMTDERWKRLFSAFAKMSLWDGIDESKNQKAKKESYSIITGGHTKDSGLSDSLAEYELVAKKKNPVYRAWNAGEDAIWKAGAAVLGKAGYHLTSDLLKLSASGSGNIYRATEGSYAANLLKNDEGINNFVKNQILSYRVQSNKSKFTIPTVSYEIPLGNGDLGAALHWTKLDIQAKLEKNGKWTANITVKDTFDFTQLKNPFLEDSLLKGLLWTANNVAYYDQKWGLLDPVKVEITYTKKF